MSRSRIAMTWPLLAAALVAAALALGGCSLVAEDPASSPGPALSAATSGPLQVSAAATLREAFAEIAEGFERETGVEVLFNFGASGVLQKQIEGGGPVDVFASAAPRQVNELVAGGFASAEDAATFAANRLAIIVEPGNPAGVAGPEGLSRLTRVATGNLDTTPAGAKAREWLESLGAWDEVEPLLVYGENSAQALGFLESGEVQAALIFANEATNATGRVETAYVAERSDLPPSRYVIVPLAASNNPDAATAFVEYVLSEPGQAILVRHGFERWE